MKTLSLILSLVAIFLALPTTLILASWDALPGDTLYPVKTGLEDVLLAVTGKTRVASKLSVQFTERRFSEANRLLNKQGSTVGYALLVEEAARSKEIVVERNDRENALQLVAKIEEYQTAIENTQRTIQTPQPTQQPETQPPPAVSQPHPSVPSPVPSAVTVPSPKKIKDAQKTDEDLEKTKKELEKIKEDLKKELPQATQKVKEEKEDRDRETEIDKEKDKTGNEKHQSDDDKEPRGKNKE